jgi:DNA-binding winged helix-turn-helix (wHTH) protein/predicted ATPase
LENACLWRGEQRLSVRPKTFDTLVYLVEHAEELVTKEELLDAVWSDTTIAEGILPISMSELRKVLGETARDPQFIATVPRRGYRFIAPVTQSDPQTAGSTPASIAIDSPSLVGREVELEQLHHLYAQALDGKRQIGVIMGEAGIGKTTLVDAFLARVANSDRLWISQGQCIHHYGEGEPYLPLLEAMGQMAKTSGGAQVVDVLRQHGPSWLIQLPSLLTKTEAEAIQEQRTTTTRERMLRELAESIETLAATRPLILVLEDLHWSDTSTLDWLDYIARRRASARLLILGTYRPMDAMVREHPVRVVTQELRVHGLCAELALDYLSEDGVATYLAHRFGAVSFSPTFCRNLHLRTNGNPLFLINVVNAMVQQKLITRSTSGEYSCKEADALTFEIPDTLRQFIEQQIRQLSLDDQTLLEASSVVGMDFSAVTVAAGINLSVEEVEAGCETLARRGQFIRPRGITEWPDGTVTTRYGFIHALYQAILYDRIPASRQARWHQQIGMRQEAGYGSRAREVAAELAEHFTRGRDTRRAAQYLWYAGDHALQRSAYQEAIAHLTHALQHYQRLSETPEQVPQELDIQLALGSALTATKGYAASEVEYVYSRARQLCQGVGETPQLFSALVGLRRFYQVRAAYQDARALGGQLLTMAQRRQDQAWLLEAHFGVGITFYYLGDFAASLTHCEQGIALYGGIQRKGTHALAAVQDSGVACHMYAALGLWALGYPERALRQSRAGLALARKLDDPYSLTFALLHSALLHVQRREGLAAESMAEEALAFALERGFAFWVAWGAILRGAALSMQGQREEAIVHMQQGLEAAQHTEARVGRSMFLALLAEVYGQTEQPDMGLRMANEALPIAHHHGERCYEAETSRIKGELLLTLSAADEAEAERCLQHALEVAGQQQARVWELRAAISLSRLKQQQNKHGEAKQLLSNVYGRFTEGFDTTDLQEAKMLLQNLQSF